MGDLLEVVCQLPNRAASYLVLEECGVSAHILQKQRPTDALPRLAFEALILGLEAQKKGWMEMGLDREGSCCRGIGK